MATPARLLEVVPDPEVVFTEKWLAVRRRLVVGEKEPIYASNAVSAERRRLRREQLSEKREQTQMNFGDVFEIRDLRKHSAGTVMTLALLLAGTVRVTPDPKRKDFYEVEGGSEVYYIHVSPVSGIIYLLAVWQMWPHNRAQKRKRA